MSRLIDADDLIEYIKIWEIGNGISSDQKEFIDCINKQYTAFDIDKVVGQLGRERRIAFLTLANAPDIPDMVYEKVSLYLDKAIEIIKGGGVE